MCDFIINLFFDIVEIFIYLWIDKFCNKFYNKNKLKIL